MPIPIPPASRLRRGLRVSLVAAVLPAAACAVSDRAPDIPPATAPPAAAAADAAAAVRRCYTIDDETLTGRARLRFEPDGVVTGEMSGSVHAEDIGYFTAYHRTVSGRVTPTGDLALRVETRIEYDLQLDEVIWNATPARLLAADRAWPGADCADVDAWFERLETETAAR